VNVMNKHDPVMEAAAYYQKFGFSVHWLRHRSKAPIKVGWTKAPPASLKELMEEYVPGYGVGIRLGVVSSEIGGAPLVIDMDIRSPDPRYRREAEELVDRFFPGLRDSVPCVETGRGFGSAHFYSMNSVPLESKNLGRSSELVKVYSPTSADSGNQRNFVTAGKLTPQELDGGFRLKAAWEVDFMCIGKQVVSPPTRHPDTGEVYRWRRGLE
jgi:hypothetical protein